MMEKQIKALEKQITKPSKQLNPTPTTPRVEDQTRERTLQAMAKELEAKFVFVMGSANKAKRLPHMSSLRISGGTEPH
jgi:hypothetical protein